MGISECVMLLLRFLPGFKKLRAYSLERYELRTVSFRMILLNEQRQIMNYSLINGGDDRFLLGLITLDGCLFLQ